MTVEHPFSTMCHVHSLEIRIWHCVAVKGSPMARIKTNLRTMRLESTRRMHDV